MYQTSTKHKYVYCNVPVYIVNCVGTLHDSVWEFADKKSHANMRVHVYTYRKSIYHSFMSFEINSNHYGNIYEGICSLHSNYND